jgi:hypothetical protein
MADPLGRLEEPALEFDDSELSRGSVCSGPDTREHCVPALATPEMDLRRESHEGRSEHDSTLGPECPGDENQPPIPALPKGYCTVMPKGTPAGKRALI